MVSNSTQQNFSFHSAPLAAHPTSNPFLQPQRYDCRVCLLGAGYVEIVDAGRGRRKNNLPKIHREVVK